MRNNIRILYPDFPPGVISSCSSRFPPMHVTRMCPFPGLMIEILNLLTRELNMTIEPVTIKDYALETDFLTGGLNSVLFQMLNNGTIDLIALPMQMTKFRAQHYSFTEVIYKVQTRIMKRVSEKEYIKIWAFFETYDTKVWYAFALVWLLQWFLSLIVHQIEAKMSGTEAPSSLETAWRVLKIQLMQCEVYELRTFAGKFSTLVFSLLQSTILLGLYGSWILANIIQREQQESTQTVQNMLQLLRSKSHYFVTHEPNTFFFEKINQSTSFPYGEFREVFRDNPFRYLDSVDKVLNEVRTQNALSYMQDDDRTNFYSRPYCYYEAVRLGMPMAGAHLMFPKGSSFVGKFNWAIKRNKSYLLRLSKKYAELLKMSRDCETRKGYQPLTIEPYVGLFAVCLTIIVGAFGVLTIEILIGRFGTLW